MADRFNDEVEDNILEEINGLKEIISSRGWSQYCALLNKHVLYLQQQVNIAVRQGKDREAFGFLSRIDECSRIVQIVRDRLKELGVK